MGQETSVGPHPSPGDGLLTLASRCVVVVRSDGVQLQQPLQAAPLPLESAHLHLLAALDVEPIPHPRPVVEDVARRIGVQPADLTPFVRTLRVGRWLHEGATTMHPAVPDHPTLGSRQPFDLGAPGVIAVRVPLSFRLRNGAFELIDHEGFRTAVLGPAEVHALGRLIKPIAPNAALAELRSGPSAGLLDEAQFARLLGVLDGAGLLNRMASADTTEEVAQIENRDVIIRSLFDRHAAAQDAAEATREQRTGTKRIKVIPVAFDMGTPAGLGMIVAYAKAFEGERLEEIYDFRTDWVWSEDRFAQFTSEPAIYLFSNYLWSHEQCIDISARIKAASPSSITIHGGPDTPKYERDTVAYLAAHPHVDIAVRGEGELTTAETLAAVASIVGREDADLSVLASVAGISYRDGERTVRNPDRDRIADLNTLPSPFLTGLFDVFADVPDLFVTLETNRGCPYGCTFCDWGSATTSRVRQFDIERVFAEIGWCSQVRVTSVSVADANFGMFKRDVDIAQRVADVKQATGHPKGFGVAFAKNTVKHLLQIIRVLADAGIMTQGVLSLQSMDLETLDVIRRSNIKTERYDALADEMRHAQLPLMVELMMGLPGQTIGSFADDLQQCLDREIPARINHTTLLVNSPMNDPAYLAEHRIETSAPVGPGLNASVVSTSSFTQKDYGAMERLRLSFLLYENWGVLRHVSRFVRHETGLREIDLYDLIRTRTEARPEVWPALHVLAVLGTSMMAPPYSWALVTQDLRRFLTSEVGISDDTALEAVLRTQHALLPAYGRRFPEAVQLPHDVVAWNRAMLAAKGSGHRTDWTDLVPRLIEFGPGELTVDDPDRVVETSLGLDRELTVVGVNWELDSPLSRARIVALQLSDWVTERVLPRDEHPARTPTSVAAPGRRADQPVGSG